MAINLAANPSIFKNIKKILVLKFRHIGDVLLTVPAIRALKETFPDAGVSVLVNSGTEDVLTGSPLIDELIVFDRTIKKLSVVKRYIKEIKFLEDIRTKGFDMTVDLTGGDRAAVVSFLSGARHRLAVNPGKKGFVGKKFFYTRLANIDKQKHMVLQNLDVVRQFNINTENLDVDFFIPEQDLNYAMKTLTDNKIKKNDFIVVIQATSKWLFKCWKDELFAELIDFLHNKGLKVLITSSRDHRETEKTDRIISLCNNPPINLGATTIKQLAAFLQLSDLFIGLDSAPMHIAAAVKTPVIALFGPTDENVWGPYGDGNIVIAKNLSCKPCKKGMCDGIQLRKCMTAIKPDDVIETIYKDYRFCFILRKFE